MCAHQPATHVHDWPFLFCFSLAFLSLKAKSLKKVCHLLRSSFLESLKPMNLKEKYLWEKFEKVGRKSYPKCKKNEPFYLVVQPRYRH